MTDSDSDYDFESADEGEGASPKIKDKHHEPKLAENVVAGSESVEIVEGDKHSCVPLKDCGEAPKENKCEEETIEGCSANSRQEEASESETLDERLLALGLPSEEVGVVQRSEEVGVVQRSEEVGAVQRSEDNRGLLGDIGNNENKNSAAKIASNSDVDCEEKLKNDAGSNYESEPTSSGRLKDLAGGDTRTFDQWNEKQNNLEFTSVLDKMSQSESESSSQQSSGWGWGSWGLSVLSTATSSVSTFTNQVGEGLTTVLEGVETTFGAPPPEALAKEEAERMKSASAAAASDDKSAAEDTTEETNQPSFLGLITGVSGVIEKTGTKVLNSGLDTLEFLGKKTMDVLQENDPGLKKKRSLFQDTKPNLSEALREAKLKAENEIANDNNADSEEPKIHYTKLFDDFQGLVHLEALEMLSKQSDARLPSLTSAVKDNDELSIEEELAAISTNCELEDFGDESDEEDDYDFTELVNKLFSELPVPANSQKLIQAYENSRKWLEESTTKENKEESNPKEMYAHALESLAELTARGVEIFHKTSELILSSNNSKGSKASEVLSSIAKLICKELNIVASKYGDAINDIANGDDASAPNNSLITEVFLEASNSNFYMLDALKLTSPVLQVALLENLVNAR